MRIFDQLRHVPDNHSAEAPLGAFEENLLTGAFLAMQALVADPADLYFGLLLVAPGPVPDPPTTAR